MVGSVRHSRVSLLIAITLAVGACGSNQSSPPASNTDIYSGYSGQQVVFEGSGDSGAFNNALTNTFFADFQKKTGATVSIDSFCCGVAKLAGQEDAGNVTLTMTQWATLNDWKEAEAQDLLVKLDPSIIPLDLLTPDSYDAYGIVDFPYAAMVVWNTNKFPLSGKHPTKIEDVFDTTNFPGTRCIDKYPQFGGTLEAAALASGVSRDHLYPLDVNRALKELDTIKGNTIFWTSTAQGLQALLTGQCAIGISWNGPTYDLIRTNPGAPLAVAYGDAVWTAPVWTIPKGTPNMKAAEALLQLLVTDTAAQAKMLSQTSYVSVSLKAPLSIPSANQAFALAGDNLKASIQEDDAWYGRNIASVLQQFNTWLVS
jgi:putative spermidine/putrescine transport system substrate-binding protein